MLERHSYGNAKAWIPAGCWQRPSGEGVEAIEWIVLDEGHSLWNGESVEYRLHGTYLWILEQDGIGTRWRFRVESDRLRLGEPEGFRYLGEGQYVYFDLDHNPRAVDLDRASCAGRSLVTERFPDGAKKTEITWTEDDEGVQLQYYPNGAREAEISFKQGRKHGRATWWFGDGKLKAEEYFNQGELDGHQVFWDKKGHQVREEYYRNGELTETRDFSDSTEDSSV